ncbi:MAG: InlB B-repeat-containing protein, partial [Gemmiger sp.]
STEYTFGIGATLPVPVKTGYDFAGWYNNENLTGDSITAIGTTETDEKTFYAKWTPKTYTVEFNTNGGSAIADKTVSWEDTVLSGITDPAKPGWEFTGWKCADVTVESTTKYSGLVANDGVSEITLVAQWKDIAAPVISGITNGETYCAAQTVTVTDNVAVTSVTVDETAVTLDANGQFVLNPKEGAQTIVAKDAAGNSATVAVTVNNGHTGGTATCTKLAVCEICGTSYGSLDTSRHNLQHVAAKEATVTEAGHPEYWICSDCGKTFSDANGKTSLSLAGVLTAKLPPAIIEGAGQSVTAGERKALTFRSNAAFRDFIRVEVDGQTLASANYTYQEGSIIVTLQPAYVASLSAGEHTLGIVSTGGVATTVFSVHGTAPAGNSVSAQNSALNSPPTGDDSPVGLLVVAFLVSGGLLAGTWWINKKKRSGK